MNISDDLLSDEEIAEILAAEIDSVPPKEEPPPMARKIVKAPDVECEIAVSSLLARYPGLISGKTPHWSLALASILSKISYRVARNCIANYKKFDPNAALGYIGLIQNNLSSELLDDIHESVKGYAEEHPEVLIAAPEDQSIITLESGNLAYVGETTKVEESSSSKSSEGWASW